MLKKIICSIVTCLFLFNNIAYGLSPMPGSTQPGIRDAMYAAGQKLFAAKRGPGTIDFGIALPPGFFGKTPRVEGVTNFRKADYEHIPAGWTKNYVNRELIMNRDLVSALRCFRKNEAEIPGNLLPIEEGYFEVDEGSGELPIARIERFEGDKYKLVVHTKFVKMWNDLVKNDIWFDYTFPDGEKRTASLAWAIFYRLAKHEMTDIGKYIWKNWDSYVEWAPRGGHVSPIMSWVHPIVRTDLSINQDELSANSIGGRYNTINDSIWMWFLGSYCFGNTTRYNNDTLRKRLRWFFNGKTAKRLNIDQEFPNLLGPTHKEERDFAVKLALNINRAYFSEKNRIVPEFTVDQKLIDAYRKRTIKISDSYYATGGADEAQAQAAADSAQGPAAAHEPRKAGRPAQPGKSPEAAWEVIVSSDVLRKALLSDEPNNYITNARYMQQFEKVGPALGYREVPSISTVKRDLGRLSDRRNAARYLIKYRFANGRSYYVASDEGRRILSRVQEILDEKSRMTKNAMLDNELEWAYRLASLGYRTSEQISEMKFIIENPKYSVPPKVMVICPLAAEREKYGIAIPELIALFEKGISSIPGYANLAEAANSILTHTDDPMTEVLVKAALVHNNIKEPSYPALLRNAREAVAEETPTDTEGGLHYKGAIAIIDELAGEYRRMNAPAQSLEAKPASAAGGQPAVPEGVAGRQAVLRSNDIHYRHGGDDTGGVHIRRMTDSHPQEPEELAAERQAEAKAQSPAAETKPGEGASMAGSAEEHPAPGSAAADTKGKLAAPEMASERDVPAQGAAEQVPGNYDLPTAATRPSLRDLAPHDIINALLSKAIVYSKKGIQFSIRNRFRLRENFVEYERGDDTDIYWFKGEHFGDILKYLMGCRQEELLRAGSGVKDSTELLKEVMKDILAEPYISDDIRARYDTGSHAAAVDSFLLLSRQLKIQLEHVGIETGATFIMQVLKGNRNRILAHARAERAVHLAVIKKDFEGDIGKYRQWRRSGRALDIDVKIEGGEYAAISETRRTITGRLSYNEFAAIAHDLAEDVAGVSQLLIGRWHADEQGSEKWDLPTAATLGPVRPTILVVDDDQAFRDSMQSFLESQFHVLTAGDGEEALRVIMAAAVPPAIILSDIDMPNMNGYMLSRACHDIPFIFLSGHEPEQGRLAPNVKKTLVKGDYPAEQLMQSIREALLQPAAEAKGRTVSQIQLAGSPVVQLAGSEMPAKGPEGHMGSEQPDRAQEKISADLAVIRNEITRITKVLDAEITNYEKSPRHPIRDRDSLYAQQRLKSEIRTLWKEHDKLDSELRRFNGPEVAPIAAAKTKGKPAEPEMASERDVPAQAEDYFGRIDEKIQPMVTRHDYEFGGDIGVVRNAIVAAALGEISIEKCAEILRTDAGAAEIIVRPIRASIEKARAAAVARPISMPEAISVYAARLGLKEGPGSLEPTPNEIASFYPIYEILKTQRVEIWVSQDREKSLTRSLKDDIADHNRRIRERAGNKEDTITIKPFNPSNLRKVLARKDDNARRIFVNDASTTEAFRNLMKTSDGMELLRGNRFFTADIGAGADDVENSVRQAWLMKVSILSALLTDKNREAVGIALEAELAGRIEDKPGTFLDNLVKTDNEGDNISLNDIMLRAEYFISHAVKLSEFIAQQLRVLKAFWTAA